MIIHSISALQECISLDLIVAKCRWVDGVGEWRWGGGGHSLAYSNAKLIVAVRPLPIIDHTPLKWSSHCLPNCKDTESNT